MIKKKKNTKSNNQCTIKNKERSNFFYWNRKVIKTGGDLGRRPFKFKLPTPRLRHSLIDKFLLGSRDKLMLINTTSTIRETNQGLLLAAKILRHRGKLLIVDTRPDVSPFLEMIENGFHTIPSVISFSGSRWVGGTVSNWKIISQKVSHYGHISRQLDDFLSQNEIQISGYKKMKLSYPGFLENQRGNMALKLNKKKPDLIFVVNPNESRHIIQEANGLKIPVIALVDSNTNLDGIKISIPVNYDTMFWVYHCVNTLIRLAGSLQIYDKSGPRSVQFKCSKKSRPFLVPSSPLKEGIKNHKIRKNRIIYAFKESRSFAFLYSIDMGIDIGVDPAVTDIELIGGILGIAALFSLLGMALRSVVRRGDEDERPPLIVYVCACCYYWIYILEDTYLGVLFRKTVFSLQEQDVEQLHHRLVVPRGRNILFRVTVADGQYVKCRFRVASQHFNFHATPHNLTEGLVRIQHGLHRANPRSQAGYPFPTTPGFVMPIILEGVAEEDYYGWFFTSQQGNAAVPVPFPLI